MKQNGKWKKRIGRASSIAMGKDHSLIDIKSTSQFGDIYMFS